MKVLKTLKFKAKKTAAENSAYSWDNEYKFTYNYARSDVAKFGTRKMSKKLDRREFGNKHRACFIWFAEEDNNASVRAEAELYEEA